MRRKDYIEIARIQMATAGLTVLNRDILYAAYPAAWPGRQDALLNGASLREILDAVRVEYPAAIFFEFLADATPMLGAARSMHMIEDRIEHLTGLKAKSVTVVEPGSIKHQEKTRVQELKQPEVDEFAGFSPDDFIKSLPTWSCAARADGILKLQRFWRRHPDLYRPEVYDASEKNMRVAFEAELRQEAA